MPTWDFRVFSFKVYGLRVGIVGHRVLQLRVRSLGLGFRCLLKNILPSYKNARANSEDHSLRSAFMN